MNKRCPAEWALVASALMVYFLIGISLTGVAGTLVVVLSLAFGVWFLVYKFR